MRKDAAYGNISTDNFIKQNFKEVQYKKGFFYQ